tara:strand:+ start:764 stop:1000 length:237 start_codon:yes stop_codon:yes gene_type:complete
MSPQDPWETHNGGTNGWAEYKRLVINELERANHRLDMMDKRLGRMEKHITILQTKAAAWAAGLAITISGGMTLLFKFF